ncbi:MAG: hypothetical protein NT091_01135, partial [Candidatus Falkowbacteria bacterium]|nr:hypothetical protein [Candidatus Falkowbacteria bacterium]
MSEFVTSTFIVCMIFMCVGFVTIEQKIMNIHKTNPIDEISYGRMLKVKRKLEIALSILVCSMLFYIIFALAGWFGVMLITI